MRAYQTKIPKLSGSKYSEVVKQARLLYRRIAKRTKRKAYVRSIYFKREKVFFDIFWLHLEEKSFRDRTRRLKFFSCAIELIKNSHYPPISKPNVDRKIEVLHRFTGISPTNEIFFVQIKENIKTKRKYLISVFPLE